MDNLKNNNIETNTKNNPNPIKPKEQMFNMIVKEAKFNEHKVGYIFILKPYLNKEGEKKYKCK